MCLIDIFLINRLGVGGQGPYSSTHSTNHNVRLSMSPYSGFLAKIATKEDESKLWNIIYYTFVTLKKLSWFQILETI